MPIYYFDLAGGLKDETGCELANDRAAKQEAKLRAFNSNDQLEDYRGYHAIIVRNGQGDEIVRTAIRKR